MKTSSVNLGIWLKENESMLIAFILCYIHFRYSTILVNLPDAFLSLTAHTMVSHDRITAGVFASFPLQNKLNCVGEKRSHFSYCFVIVSWSRHFQFLLMWRWEIEDWEDKSRTTCDWWLGGQYHLPLGVAHRDRVRCVCSRDECIYVFVRKKKVQEVKSSFIEPRENQFCVT
jgi:hypothetical protein